MPGLCIVLDSNAMLQEMIDKELWLILQKIEYQQRYDIYQEHLSRGYLSSISLLNRLIDLQPKIAKWTKSIRDTDQKDVIEQMRKEASKLANNGNSLIVGYQITRIVSNFDNLIKLLIKIMDRGTFS